MKRTAGIVGGLLLLAVVGLTVLYGLRVPAVQAVLQPLGDAIGAAVDGFRGYDWPSLTTGVAGNGGLAAGIALAGFALTTILVPPARQGRGLVISAVAWTLVGVLLFAPGLTA